MKRVSFNVAKALKEAGYPQSDYDEMMGSITKPSYLDVWLWLWREKKVAISTNRFEREWGSLVLTSFNKPLFIGNHFSGPEEAIIAAIKYLADNNLLK